MSLANGRFLQDKAFQPLCQRLAGPGRFEPISSIAIRWSPRSDFAPATIANRKCRITTYEVPQSTRSEKWTKRTGSVHRSAKFDGQVKNCYVVEFTDNEPSPLNVDLGVAPESGQPYGRRAKEHLSSLCFQVEATIRPTTTDRYDRTVARVECRGLDANLEMVKAGLAWAYTKYQTDPVFPRAELAARQAGVGMWADAAPAAQTSPWAFRHSPQPLMMDPNGCITGPRGGRYRLLPNGRKQYGC